MSSSRINYDKDVLTDGVILVCKDLDKLHAFAKALGFKKEWFHGKQFPHYDIISLRLRMMAYNYGARRVGSHELVRILRGSDGRDGQPKEAD